MKTNFLLRVSLLILLLFPLTILHSWGWTGRNVLEINIVSSDTVLVESELMPLSQIKDKVKQFISKPENDWINAEYYEHEVELLGEVRVSKGIVSVQCSRTVDYAFFIAVNNEIEKAYSEMRNEFALQQFQKSYKALDLQRQRIVNECIPKRISEAEPKYIVSNGNLVRNGFGYYF